MTRRPRSTEAGSSLIEVVVAMGVSAIGLLAMAGLLAVSTKLSRVNQHQAQAVLMAQALAERLRANPSAAAQGDYAYEPDADDDVTAADAACGAVCTPAQRAERDLAVWLDDLGRTLPQGTGLVRADGEQGLVDVVVAWTEGGATTDAPSRHRCPADAGLPASSRCVRLRVAL